MENAYYLEKYIVEMLFIHRKYTTNQLGKAGCLKRKRIGGQKNDGRPFGREIAVDLSDFGAAGLGFCVERCTLRIGLGG